VLNAWGLSLRYIALAICDLPVCLLFGTGERPKRAHRDKARRRTRAMAGEGNGWVA
jgi:hypothetical protein